MNEIYLIGLGNPGKKFSNNRHNVGFLLLENLSKKFAVDILISVATLSKRYLKIFN